MADRVFLSLWLPPRAQPTLAPLEAALRALPESRLAPGVRGVRVTPLDWTQPALLEERFTPGLAIAEAIALLREYLHDDYAFEAESAWDVWVPASAPTGSPWQRTPSSVRVTLFGPHFESAAAARPREEGDLAVDLGPEALFLAPEQPANAETKRKLQENLAALVAFSNRLAAAVHPERRRLWSEAEEDFSARITARLQWVQ